MSPSERKSRVDHYRGEGMGLSVALETFGLTRHQYYRRPGKATGRRGRRPTGTTVYHGADGVTEVRGDGEVLSRIREVQADDDLRCGHRRMAARLQLEGYLINHKKVYRLMGGAGLLLGKARRESRPYVRHRVAAPDKPLTLMEMDIKQIWVEEHRRYAYILTILDTFDRSALYWRVGYSMKWGDVESAWAWVIEHHLQASGTPESGLRIEVRSDNGPQFLAKKLRSFLRDNHLDQVFTHPYTPQENGHVESFHSILATALAHQHFWTLAQLECRLAVFYEKYNNERPHSGTVYLPPVVFRRAWESGFVEVGKDKKKRTVFKLNVPRHRLGGYLGRAAAAG